MSFIDHSMTNSVEEYMKLIHRTDDLFKKYKTEKETISPDKQKEMDEKIDDIDVIRKQLISHVKEKGISREIIEKTTRLLSIF